MQRETQSLTVPTPPGFVFHTTLMSHGWLQLAPFRHDEPVTDLRRTHGLGDGTVVALTFEGVETDGPADATGGEAIRVTVSGAQLTEERRREIETVTRRIFHLDLDLSSFYERVREEERYRWVEPYGAGRLLRSPTVWEDLAKTLLTTNTTWAQTRGMVRRLAELGEPAPEGLAAEDSPFFPHAFPTPETVAGLDPGELGETIRAGYRGPYLQELAEGAASGELEVESWTDPELLTEELYRRVTALTGFGPYAAGTVLKLLGHYDQLALDSAARGMYARQFNGGEKAPDSEIAARYEPYGEWRGLALWMDLMREWFEEEEGREL